MEKLATSQDAVSVAIEQVEKTVIAQLSPGNSSVVVTVNDSKRVSSWFEAIIVSDSDSHDSDALIVVAAPAFNPYSTFESVPVILVSSFDSLPALESLSLMVSISVAPPAVSQKERWRQGQKKGEQMSKK